MSAPSPKLRRHRELRSLLVLGRISNLPTVWSNCLAGWLLGGGGGMLQLGVLCLGATCLYLGGMFLNDAFDADFDRQFRKERPIPSGAIGLAKVWGWGFGWLSAGVICLSALGPTPLFLGVLLSVGILLYDAIHKAVTLSPLLMAGCRFLLYLLASSTASKGINGLAIWSGLALASYIVGLSFMARRESTRGRVQFWPMLPLCAPVVLAWVVNAGEFKIPALGCALVLLAWSLHCLQHTYWTATASIGRTVSGLLAGICLVDLLALAGGTIPIAALFLVLFAGALALQRLVPAT